VVSSPRDPESRRIDEQQLRSDQFARVPVRLRSLPQERFGVLMRLILCAHTGRNYLGHACEFSLAQFSCDLGWENATTPTKERSATRQKLRRWLRSFDDEGLLKVTVSGGSNARVRVELTGALVQEFGVTITSRSPEQRVSRSKGGAKAEPQPDPDTEGELQCHVPRHAKSRDSVTFDPRNVTFVEDTKAHGHSLSERLAAAECHVLLDGRTTTNPRTDEELDHAEGEGAGGMGHKPIPLESLDPSIRAHVERGRIAHEADFLAALVKMLDARPIETAPLCRYPAHRNARLDWISHGITTCGVCHPSPQPRPRHGLPSASHAGVSRGSGTGVEP
jgi:hypothetical protein